MAWSSTRTGATLVTVLILITFDGGGSGSVAGKRVSGTFNPREFFQFIVKFGYQRTEQHDEFQTNTNGYVYGNISAAGAYPVNLTLALLSRQEFREFYGNRTLMNRDLACQRMFHKLDTMAYDETCNPKAGGDYLRRIPCPTGMLCSDEKDNPGNVIRGNQLTYIISLPQPRFWYLAMVACYRNTTTCEWHHFDPHRFNMANAPDIQYDLQLVNGNPQQSGYSPMTYNFSFEQQNTLEMYLIFFTVYLVLVPLQVYAMRRQKHPMTRLFTISLVLEFVSLCFILVHMIRFAMNGIGNENFRVSGDILDIFSRTSFMLILLLLAKGWAVTRQQISRTGWLILMSIWIPYAIFNVMLYIWNRTEEERDPLSDQSEFQQWPGRLLLVCRSMIMLWFLWELRSTMRYEHSVKKLDFLLHFGASSLVWFIYLPVVALVANHVSPLWRYKLLLGITNSADCLAYIVMTGLLWPNRAGQYLLLAGPKYSGMDELEEFSEAPHVVNNCSISSHNTSSNGGVPAAHVTADQQRAWENYTKKNVNNNVINYKSSFNYKQMLRNGGGNSIHNGSHQQHHNMTNNLLDAVDMDILAEADDCEEEEDEFVINDFARGRSIIKEQDHHPVMLIGNGGKVIRLNEGLADDDYEHISMDNGDFDDGRPIFDRDISTDLLNCDYEPGDGDSIDSRGSGDIRQSVIQSADDLLLMYPSGGRRVSK